MIQTAIFFFLAAMILAPALLVITVRNVFHCALWLILSLFGVAGMYAFLAADFLFAVQILVYVGGVMVLLLFVVLLSGRPADWAGRQMNDKAWLAALFSGFLAAAIVSVIAAWPPMTARGVSAIAMPTTSALGRLLLGEMLLPFEIISLVLVTSMIGAVLFSTKRPVS